MNKIDFGSTNFVATISTEELWKTAVEASSKLREKGIPHCLIGTLALWALGYDVDPGDVDFMVASKVEFLDTEDGQADTGSDEESPSYMIAGCKCDFIELDEVCPVLPAIKGTKDQVPVAGEFEVLRLKRYAATRRTGDGNFLMAWDHGRIGMRRAP